MHYIRIYSGNDLLNQIQLSEDPVTIGRAESNTIVLPEAGVSKKHAIIEFEYGGYFITDLESSNGVYLNKEKIFKSKLKYWDEIQIHNFVLKFMAKPALSGLQKDEQEAGPDLEDDKTRVFKIDNKQELDKLRQKTKQCYVNYFDEDGLPQSFVIKKPRITIGGSADADIKIKGLFAPKIAATIERRGNGYELIPGKRGKVIFQTQPIFGPAKLIDDSSFLVREMEFKFFNRLASVE